jgi:site-specific recombinase XerD
MNNETQNPESGNVEKEFYDNIPNPSTRKEYRNGLQRFTAWFGKSADEILEMRKADLKSEDTFARKRFERELERFHAYLKAPKPQGGGAATNSARTLCLGLRQFFNYYEVGMKLKRGSAVGKSVLTEKSYPLTIEDIRKMYAVGNLRERVILSLAKDLGIRIGDFVQIKKTDLPDLNQEAPIPFDIMTGKEEVLSKSHLSAETVELLKTYLPTIADNPNPYLFPTNGKHGIDEDTLGQALKALAKKAGIVIPASKQLTFHTFRKLFISTGKNVGVSDDVVKALCGKSVDSDIRTYMTTIQWRENFAKIAEQLKIVQATNKNHVKLEELEVAVAEMKRRLGDKEMDIDGLKQRDLERTKDINDLKAQIDKLSHEELKKGVKALRQKRKI